MARKSALESLNQRLEGDGEGGDTVIDITVIADSDGEAAEAIEDAIETGEATGEAEAIQEADDAAEQEAQDMTELAAVIRQYGLNAGMAAVINVLVPCSSMGIALPAVESLDASGRNMERAERLAAAFEASGEGFWATTKNVFKKIWQWIKDICRKITTMIGGLESRMVRMAQALDKRTFDEDRNKDSKMKQWKQIKENKSYLGDLKASTKIFFDKLNAIKMENVGLFKEEKDEVAQFHSELPDDKLKVFGVKWKDASKTDSSTLEDISSFFDTEDVEVTGATLTAYNSTGAIYKASIELVRDAKRELPAAEKVAEANLKGWESSNVGRPGDDKNSDEQIKRKKALQNAKDFLKVTQKVLSKCTKCLTFSGTNYLKCGRAILSHTKDNQSNINYKKD